MLILHLMKIINLKLNPLSAHVLDANISGHHYTCFPLLLIENKFNLTSGQTFLVLHFP